MTSGILFADTSFYLAIMRVSDHAHAGANAFLDTFDKIVTTEFVILELGNACSRASDHKDFLVLLNGIRASSAVTVIPLDSHLMERGLKLMAQRTDKDWSLTDCISFVVMQDMGITDALSTDRHFEQAGFRALLKTD